MEDRTVSDRSGYKIDEIEFLDEYSEQEFKDYLKYVVDVYGQNLHKTALGITKKVIESGIDGLSENQKNVFQNFVLEPYTQKECVLCQTEIPWCEMHANIPKDEDEEDGFCSWCRHREEKDD
jgi:hypothetical protein